MTTTQVETGTSDDDDDDITLVTCLLTYITTFLFVISFQKYWQRRQETRTTKTRQRGNDNDCCHNMYSWVFDMIRSTGGTCRHRRPKSFQLDELT